MRRKIILTLTAIFMMASILTGCSFEGSIENLLSPPKLSEEQDEVYDALVSSVGSDIKLQYPKSGSYRSAFIIDNFDEEDSNEAIVFYQSTAEKKNDGSVRINILDICDGEWRSVYDHAGIGTGIDRVIFSELGASERKSIIIGYSMLSNEKNFKSYIYEGGVLVNTFSDNYSSIFPIDMDNDNKKELVVIHPNNENTSKQAYISIVTDDGENVYESTSVLLNSETTEFINIASGHVGADTPAIYIDGISGGQISTEIIYSINGTLRNPIYLSESDIIKDTFRPYGYLSTDIDLDGVIEIPTVSYFPGYTQNSSEQFHIVDWNVLTNYTITKKYSSYYSISDSYCFIIPSRWEGFITVKNDTATGDLVFYKYNSDLINSTEELMRFSIVLNDNQENKLENGYSLITIRDNISYLVKFADNPNEPLILTNTEVINNFYLME